MRQNENNVYGDPNIAVFEANDLNQVPVMETNVIIPVPVPVVNDPVPLLE